MKKNRRTLLRIPALLLAILLAAALITGGLILHKASGETGEFTYLILLGTTINGTEPSPLLQDRIQAAAAYLHSHPEVTVIVTGGKGDAENLSEAQCMFRGLTELGIAPERILQEDRAASTAENFQFSVSLLEQQLGYVPDKIGILSSEFHLLRAGMLAKHHGIDAVTIPAVTTDRGQFLLWFLREIPVLWIDSIRLLF